MTRREAPVSPPVVLTIAGSDSGGGAGIQADLKTIEACGGFGTSAITSVTAQNTCGVQGSHRLPIADIDAQIEAVLDDFEVAAVKTGMLATSEVIDLVVDHAADLPSLVVDPVMVAASGDRLLAEAAEDAYETLLAEAALVTPNADEAEVLTGVTVEGRESAERAGRILVEEQGADAALVKGGHVPCDHVVDTLVQRANGESDAGETTVTTFRHDRIGTDATHGSGCTLSSAIATHLAHGEDLRTAVGAGVDLLARAVRYNVAVGDGPGAVHHLVDIRNDASRGATLDLVDVLAERVCERAWTGLVPDAGLGLAAATPHAERTGDIAAVAGRLDESALGDRQSPEGGSPDAVGVRFDGDRALAGLLLAAREVDPAIRFAALVNTAPVAVEDLDGHVLTVEGGDLAAGPMEQLPDAIRSAVAAAEPAPVAVTADRPDAEGKIPAVVLGETTTAVLDRLESLARA